LVNNLSVQEIYTTVLKHFIRTGRAPHFTELASNMNIDPDQARSLQHAAADAGVGSWFIKGADYVECWAPFSNVPTHHLIEVNGEQKWYGQCGLEALATCWMFPHKEVKVTSRCVHCSELVTVIMQDGEVLSCDPVTAVGHMNAPLSVADWDTQASFY
jgi:hypothetical protein